MDGWFHLVVTVNISAEDGLGVWVDGVRRADVSLLAEEPTVFTDRRLAIGPYYGDYDEVTIWDGILSQAEIDLIHAAVPDPTEQHQSTSLQTSYVGLL